MLDRRDAESPTQAMDDEARTPGFEGEGAGFGSGQVLGNRYRVVGRLGAGGMGEVWRAYDLKLRVEVALKALRSELVEDDTRLGLLRSEVRAAREVTSPNVCRIFDLVELDGQELVSMEYVDGTTLLEVLRDKAPLDPPEAQEIASQFLAGLEAIHQAGLVHRDVKPENIMVTRTGRVVLMDFGLARSSEEGAGSVSGTPAYMAPEQARGVTDPRSDLFSAGVILAEMVSPEGIRDFESRTSVWNGIRAEPVLVPDSPWAPVVKRAVAKDPEDRFASAHELTRALEEVAFRVLDETGLKPYPGLSSFDEKDAEYFFGREAEVEAVWQKLQSSQILGVIGASGAGKSSFLGAGLVPARPDGWSVVRCTPGNAALASLRRGVIPKIEEDGEAVKALAAGGDEAVVEAYSTWRRRHNQALLVVDQFEELFTQNAEEEQTTVAELLGRIALDADVHVVLSMRDDFLMRCHEHEAFAPIFSELTPLRPPIGGALRRAVVQPALRCGYRFEDEELADEILAEVEGERGVLPLLAFALARLWEKRDKENGLITRQAYRDIGGVGGALAGHAEDLMERLGEERHGTVRELFRNLVTAQGTRAARDTEELLSVFRDNRDGADEVLHALVDARLLTSYEVPSNDGPGRQRVEVIHESLLRAWPRLVRWQAQDAEGALLRDQLRQAAASWDNRGRSDDLLWTGAAYREYMVWRERYPGGLTELEEAFAQAMTSLATRRRRRRRMAVAAAFAVLLVGLAVVASFWRRSVLETRRAEAQKLIALGQLQLEGYPTSTVAHAIASLEQSDTPEARRLALDALWKGPTAFVASDNGTWSCRFTPDGRWLIQSRFAEDGSRSHLTVFGADGSNRSLEDAHPEAANVFLPATSDSGRFVSYGSGPDATWEHVLWSVADGRKLAVARYKEPAGTLGIAQDTDRKRVVLLVVEKGQGIVDALGYDGSIHRLGVLDFKLPTLREWGLNTSLDPRSGRWLVALVDGEVLFIEIGNNRLSAPRVLDRLDGTDSRILLDPGGRFVASANVAGEIRIRTLNGRFRQAVLKGLPEISSLGTSIDGLLLWASVQEGWASVWDVSGDAPRFLRWFDSESGGALVWDAAGRQVASKGPGLKFRVWTMKAPVDAEPLKLIRGDVEQVNHASFGPRGRWLATADNRGLSVWYLAGRFPLVLRRHSTDVNDVVFAPDGSWLASSSNDRTVRLWPLTGEPPPSVRTLMELDNLVLGLAVSPDGERILAGTNQRGNRLLRPGGGDSSILTGFTDMTWGVAFSPDGRLAAATGGNWLPHEQVIRVWDVATRTEVKVLEVGEPLSESLQFTTDGDLVAATSSGLYRWSVTSGSRELLRAGRIPLFAASADGRRFVTVERPTDDENRFHAAFFDADSGTVKRLDTFDDDVQSVAFDSRDNIVITGHVSGEIRVGSLSGSEPHLLLGHEGTVFALAVDPLGRWIASGSQDGTVRLWPMPELSKPPLHTLPRAELIAKLKTLTNLRVVRDQDSPTGWTLSHDPLPGWETVPSW